MCANHREFRQQPKGGGYSHIASLDKKQREEFDLEAYVNAKRGREVTEFKKHP
jgi:hypothetical protein